MFILTWKLKHSEKVVEAESSLVQWSHITHNTVGAVSLAALRDVTGRFPSNSNSNCTEKENENPLHYFEVPFYPCVL